MPVKNRLRHARDIAQRYLCGHCTSTGAKASTDVNTGRVRLEVTHDPGCPVLVGVVPHWHDLRRAQSSSSYSGQIFISHREDTR